MVITLRMNNSRLGIEAYWWTVDLQGRFQHNDGNGSADRFLGLTSKEGQLC